MTINYLGLDYVKKTVIPTIEKHYVRKGNPAHNYLDFPLAMEQVSGCLERARWDYCPDFIAKAVQQFLCVNKGHFFDNGNKRLALVILLSFLLENGYALKELEKDEFAGYLNRLFPEFTDFDDESDFSGVEFAYYNLTIIVADSGKYGWSHDQLKEKIGQFLNFSVMSPNELEDAGNSYQESLED